MKTAPYLLFADEIEIARYSQPPRQEQIDRAAVDASKRGWNGTVLKLVAPDASKADVYPSEEALTT